MNKKLMGGIAAFCTITAIFLWAVVKQDYRYELLAKENAELKARAPEVIEKEVPIEVKLESPFNTPEIIQIADAIIKLQPKTTPFVAKFMALHIAKESKEKRLDPDLVTAQFWVESEFNPNALSKAGAIGIGQVRYEVWKKTPQLKDNGVDAKHKLYWIDANIQSSTDILKTFLDEAKGDLAKALYRYYCGSPQLEKGKAPWQHEYVAKILYYYFKIRDHRLHGIPIEVDEIVAAPIVQEAIVIKSVTNGAGMSKSEPSTRK
jgi:soluble lytic murein transglycosylase-like protein